MSDASMERSMYRRVTIGVVLAALAAWPAATLARQSQSLLTLLRGQTTERLRTDGMSFEPELQDASASRPECTLVSFALLPGADLVVTEGTLSLHAVEHLPPLAFDHTAIVQAVVTHLLGKSSS